MVSKASQFFASAEGQDEAVIAALREWRFEPGRKGGKAVPVEAEFVAVFRLRSFRQTGLA